MAEMTSIPKRPMTYVILAGIVVLTLVALKFVPADIRAKLGI